MLTCRCSKRCSESQSPLFDQLWILEDDAQQDAMLLDVGTSTVLSDVPASSKPVALIREKVLAHQANEPH